MPRSLVIVESPTKCQTIGRYLEDWKPNSFTVSSSVGHIIDLPVKELGVDVEKNFEPRYVTAPRKTKVINELKKLAREADQILIATDEDREGEAIAWHISNVLDKALKGKKVIKRVRFNEITKPAIIAAIQNPDKIDQNRVDAQQARRIMDRLVGYQVSPLLWKTVSRGLSAGRVQSVAVRLICEREEEIKAFNPLEYWTFDGRFRSEAKDEFDASLLRIFDSAEAAIAAGGKSRAGKKPEIDNKEQADSLLAEMQQQNFKVAGINEKEVSRKAPPPFITSSLQQDAARRLGFSPKKTMMLAQQLYEGIELGDGERSGLITYMRTDSMRLADSAVEEVREYIKENHGAELLPEKALVYRGKNKSQDAHEAIRPSMLSQPPKRLQGSLSRDQLRLYQLIWNRYLACQMVPALYQQRAIDLLGGRFVFRASGSILSRKGYLEVYEDVKSESKSKKNAAEKFIPKNISKDESTDLLKVSPEQHFTKPPARFSQESLIRSLEELGIGRPSTYASIVDMILKRSYVVLLEKRFNPTDLGFTVNKILVENFSNIFNVDFTAMMETELDSVESGRPWKEVMKDFYGPFSESLVNADKRRAEIKESTIEKLDEKCPECEGGLIYKWGRNGRFIACAAFPECRYTRNPGENDEDKNTNEICEKCSSPMVVKNSRYGRFLGCSKYPDCRNTKAFDLGIDCPNEGCEGKIAERRSKRGKVFFGCTKYPDCRFASWDKPVKKICPTCANPWMAEKKSEAKGEYLLCPVCKTEIENEVILQDK
jgi:DNA topoisomerase I